VVGNAVVLAGNAVVVWKLEVVGNGVNGTAVVGSPCAYASRTRIAAPANGAAAASFVTTTEVADAASRAQGSYVRHS
jgi:hypothetical protein